VPVRGEDQVDGRRGCPGQAGDLVDAGRLGRRLAEPLGARVKDAVAGLLFICRLSLPSSAA
jgi:hypothetical protein